jgi:uncharacterized protein (TIGR02302 family)
MALEGLWTALQGPLALSILAVILLATGVLPALPPELRVGLVIPLLVALVFALKPLFAWRRPSRAATVAALEQESGLVHRPLTSLHDRLSPETSSASSQVLWQEHRLRELARAAGVTARAPRSSWRLFDPRALRVLLWSGLAASLLLGPGTLVGNFKDTIRLKPAALATQASLDAWLKPPTYTGRPPLLLTGETMAAHLADGGEVTVPENAVLTVRLEGATTPRLAFFPQGTSGETPDALKDVMATTSSVAGVFKAEAKLTRPLVARLYDGDSEIAAWPITLIPDNPPRVDFAGQAARKGIGGLSLPWKAEDDYGILSLTAEITLSDEQADGLGFESNGVFLFEPPEFAIPPGRPKAGEISATTTQDLSAHPWAGLNADIVLTATDLAGQTAQSKVLKVRLPERYFSRKLARVLVEQRKVLILTPDRNAEVAQLFDALLAYPDGLFDTTGQHLMLAGLSARIAGATTQDDIRTAVDDLWTLALIVEDGGYANARSELKALKEELERALAEGASQERIDELSRKLRDAMNRYLDAMRLEMAKRRQQAGDRPPPDGDRQALRREDLEKMLDAIEDMSRNGSREAARDLLGALDDILQNLEPGNPSASNDGDQQLEQMLDQLGDLMRQQQKLMDETGRPPQGQQGEQQEGGQPTPGDPRSGSLADRQGSLKDLLDRMMRELGNQGNQSLGEAGRRMGEAEGQLRQGENGRALEEQGKALQELQKGSRELAEQARQQGQGQAKGEAQDGEGNGNRTDPLGRPRRTTGEHDNLEKLLPSELAIRRAREIIESLRARAGDKSLPEEERGYIERLLRGLY